MNEWKQADLPPLRLGDEAGVLRFRTLRRAELACPPPAGDAAETGPAEGGPAGRIAAVASSGGPAARDDRRDAPGATTGEPEGADTPRKSPLVPILAAAVVVLAAAVVALLFRDGGGGDAGRPGEDRVAAGLRAGERMPEFRGRWLFPEAHEGAGLTAADLIGEASAFFAWSAGDEGVVARLTRAARLAPALAARPRPVRLVGLNIDASPGEARAAVEAAGADDFPVLFDRHPDLPEAERLAPRIRVIDTPAVYLFDERGRLENSGLSLEELMRDGGSAE